MNERYTRNEIEDIIGKYGSVYFEDDIQETPDDIIGNLEQKMRLKEFFNALSNYKEFSEKLRNSRLNLGFSMLLYGPPGTGKTTLARAYSKEKGIPICVVESDRLVSSLLGDTLKNISNVVKSAADIAKKNDAFVLFFDEIDAIGSERSNVHEVGEIKRAVISFLQNIDKINNQGIPLAIIGATNHQSQLDSAIWRRFTFHLEFQFPDFEIRKKIIEAFLGKMEKAGITVEENIYKNLDDEYNEIKKLSKELEEDFGQKLYEYENNILRKAIKQNSEINGLLELTYGYSGSDIERGMRVTLFKTIEELSSIQFKIIYESLKLVGGTAKHVERQEILSSKSPDISDKELFAKSDNKEGIEELPEISILLTDLFSNLNKLNNALNIGSSDFKDYVNNMIVISKKLKDKKILKIK